MKCAACGYEKRDYAFVTEKVIRFKSGKRKGEIKEVKKEYVEPDKNKADFFEIRLQGDLETSVIEQHSNIPVTLYACPICQTVRIKF